MEDDRVDDEKPLVARSNKKCRKICGWMWYMSENEDLNRGTSVVMILILRVGYKNYSYIRETQENSIKSSLQNSLSYILLQMVHANYCAPYPKWPCVKHEANIWCPCCMTSFCFRTFYLLLSSPMINVVTTSLGVTDVTGHF